MEFRDNVQLDQSRVRYGGGGSSSATGNSIGGRKVAVGGGFSGILVLILMMFLSGGNLGDLLTGVSNNTAGQTSQQGATGQPDCSGVGAVAKDERCRWVAYENALTNYWTSAFTQGFQPVAAIQMYTGSVSTACGAGSSEMGPFYCPGDTTIYIDDAFMGKLLEQLGTTRSYAAEAYVTAHEYGHHISSLTGQMQKARQLGDSTGPKSPQVRLELQADCYAGVFFANTVKDPNSPIASVTQDDLKRIVDAARAVGDDHIQRQQTGRVVEESWTHGSSAMRQYWVAKGFNSGNPGVCDTFSTDNLGPA